VPFTNHGLDHLISQELSKLSRCDAPEVTSTFPESKHWVSNFALNSFLGFEVTPEMKGFRFTFLRRAEAAFIEYEYAREALSEYVANRPRKPSLYFRALHHFEMTIAMLWQAYAFARNFTGVDAYPKGDKSSRRARLNLVYNDTRHFDHKQLSSNHLQHIWIRNDGVYSANNVSISFEEMKECLEEIGRLADRFSSHP
jgi:hypothetical protein